MNSSTTSQASESEFIEALNQTEVGAFVAKYLKPILAILALLIVGLIGWGITSYQANQNKKEYAADVYEFRQTTLMPFMEEGEISVSELVEQFEALHTQVNGSIVAFPTLIEISDELMAEQENEAALQVLNLAKDFTSDPYAQYFVATRRAALLEDSGQTAEALKTLEGLRDSSAQILTEKTYLDLGRLYKAEGDVEKARASFQHVVDNMAQNEFATLARLYLSELEAQ